MSTVLITGASTGIGRSAAQTLAATGHTVDATMRDPGDRNATAASQREAFVRRLGFAETLELKR